MRACAGHACTARRQTVWDDAHEQDGRVAPGRRHFVADLELLHLGGGSGLGEARFTQPSFPPCRVPFSSNALAAGACSEPVHGQIRDFGRLNRKFRGRRSKHGQGALMPVNCTCTPGPRERASEGEPNCLPPGRSLRAAATREHKHAREVPTGRVPQPSRDIGSCWLDGLRIPAVERAYAHRSAPSPSAHRSGPPGRCLLPKPLALRTLAQRLAAVDRLQHAAKILDTFSV